jgi:hypothetical protein
MIAIATSFVFGIYYFVIAYIGILSFWPLICIILLWFFVSIVIFLKEWRQYDFVNKEGIEEYDRVWNRIRVEESKTKR